MKKKILGVVLALVMVISISGCTKRYNAGTYEAEGQGRNGNIRVSVTVNTEGEIERVDIIKSDDKKELVEQVSKKLQKDMIEKNSYDVDVVSGATQTSKGYKEAVKKALQQAK
ncbi:MAG: FMN-binding protein [Tissierellia bacterium]|nr:FMN-binding protein [Tissierellia bacterium]